ncbi:MAG TPA: GNAT family N-acetyltransferase [Candidatus Binatia bacterium]
MGALSHREHLDKLIDPRIILGAAVVAAVRRYGARRTVYRAALRAVNTVALVKILRAVCVENVDPAFLRYPERLTATFLTDRMIRRFAADPESGMSPMFVEEALAKGDQCYGILSGDALVSYGWYSTRPTRIDPPELMLEFDNAHTYMYKGYTHPDFRGQRLHAIGMTLALDHYRSKGLKGIVSYIEADNFDSLKSAFRMGYRVFGSVYVFSFLGTIFSHTTAGCKQYDFRVIPHEGVPA